MILSHISHRCSTCFHTVSRALGFSDRVRHLASVQSLVRVAHVQYVTGRMQPIRGRGGRVTSSKVV